MKGSSLEWFAYFTLMVNVSVLLHPLVLVYAATYESVPIVSGMLLIWREVDV
jgi:antibiotic biosynthesis monooxygenase (ABM) superfamily enzyme